MRVCLLPQIVICVPSGAPLPVVSNGGIAMMTLMAGIGFLLNVAVHRSKAFEGTRRARPAVPAWPASKR